MADNILYSEMSDFQKKLMIQANYIFPKEYEEFLLNEGAKLLKIEKKNAKKMVGEDDRNNETVEVTRYDRRGKAYTKKIKKDYHKCFKRGKIYEKNGMKCLRAYNKARHAHLIEYGHKKWIRGKNTGQYVQSIPVMKWSEYEFVDEFQIDSETFLFKHFDNFVGTKV